MNAENFLVNFGYITDAPEGINRLREMIYNLAVTGALCEQKNEEGDGHVLLADIQRKKQQLIDADEYKRSPKLENIRDKFNEGLPKIPNSWAWTRLVDVGEISPKNGTNDETLVSFVSMRAISELHAAPVATIDRPWSIIKKGYTHFANGDVVLAKITPCFENGKAAVMANLTNGIGAGTTELHVVRPIVQAVEPGFIYVFLRSPYFKIVGEGHMTGTAGQKRLPTEYFATRPLPLPPIAEQKRIVAKVYELMSLCDQLETQQQERQKLFPVLSQASHDRFSGAPNPANLNRIFDKTGEVLPGDLRKSILILAVKGKLVPQDPNDEPVEELLSRISSEQDRLVREKLVRRPDTAPLDVGEEPFGIPSTWAWIRLGQIGDWGSGSTPPRGNHEFYGGKIPWLKSGELNDNRNLLGSEETVTDLALKTCSFRQNKPGDVLLAMYGATIGKVAILAETAVTNQAVCGCTPFSGVLNTYLFHYLLSQREAFHAASEGGAQPNISKVKIVGYAFPLPPHAEQHRIVAKVDQLMTIIDTLEKQQQERDHLAETFAKAVVASLTGTQIAERKEKMKAPKTELISNLQLGTKPKATDDAPLATLLTKAKGELSAKSLWQQSGLTIDAFYQQLKTELGHGWIAPPKAAEMYSVSPMDEYNVEKF